MRLSPRSPKPPRSRYMLPYALLILGAISLSCSKDPFGPEVTDSPAVPPRVISVSPANASVGPYDQTVVRIEFNKLMTDSSLKKAVSLVEPGAGARIDTSECWLYGRRWGIGGRRDLDRQIPQYRVGQTYRLV